MDTIILTVLELLSEYFLHFSTSFYILTVHGQSLPFEKI